MPDSSTRILMQQSVVRLALMFGGVVGAQGPTTAFGPLALDPRTSPAIIATGAPPALQQVLVVPQIELRPIGATGRYRVACVAVLAASGGRPRLLTGTLDLGVSPPVWTPNADVEKLNVISVPNSAFQLTMSDDGLVVMWDNYRAAGVTYSNVPVAANTFVCKRASTAVAFDEADVRAVFVGRPVGGLPWSDPRLVGASGNGRYQILFGDAALGGSGQLVRAEIDPTTGQVSGWTELGFKPSAGIDYFHSPNDLRDSTGAIRALVYGIAPSGAAHSSILFSRRPSGDAARYTLIDGAVEPAVPGPTSWFSNGCAIGGTMLYGAWSNPLGTQIHPHSIDYVLLPDADLTAGQSIAVFAPIRPANGGSPVHLTWFALGPAAAPSPIPLPPSLGSLLLDPFTAVVHSTPAIHDPYTGLAEWSFPGLPLLGVSTMMQTITFDLGSGVSLLGNAAELKL